MVTILEPCIARPLREWFRKKTEESVTTFHLGLPPKLGSAIEILAIDQLVLTCIYSQYLECLKLGVNIKFVLGLP